MPRAITTTIRVSERTWRLLRELAHLRALETGSRANASAVIADLVERASSTRRDRRATQHN